VCCATLSNARRLYPRHDPLRITADALDAISATLSFRSLGFELDADASRKP